MRATAGLFVILGIGLVSPVLGEEPAPSATSGVSTTPVAAVQPAPAEAATSAPAPTPPAATPKQSIPPVTVTSQTPLTPAEKEFVSRGYRPEIRNGQRYFCRRETQIGSRFEIKNCNTIEALQAEQASAEEALRRIQSDRPGINK